MLPFSKSNQFKADYASARADKKLYEHTKRIWVLLDILRNKRAIPTEYRAHKMGGDWNGWWDCHLSGDFVLVWQYDSVTKNGKKQEFVRLARVGSHAYLEI